MRLGIDLVVVGSRHRPLVERLLFGSVSAEVVLKAPCDVLVTAEHLTMQVNEPPAPLTYSWNAGGREREEARSRSACKRVRPECGDSRVGSAAAACASYFSSILRRWEGSGFGTITFQTPFSSDASMASASTGSGSVIENANGALGPG